MDRVTRAEAAHRLGLNKSTVTRWVQSHPALLDASGLVDLDDLRAHRDTVINPKLQTRTSETVERQDHGERPARHNRANPRSVLNTTRERTESAKAESAELDLAERLNLTLRRDEVEDAVAAAGEVLKQAGQQLARDKAEALARISDPRHMERALEDLMRELLTKGAQALSLAVVSARAERAA